MTEKSTAEFEWRDWPGECECGGPMKYYTDSENDEAIAQHADPVICIGCGSVGHIDVRDEDDVTAEMCNPDYTPITECIEIGMNPRQMFAEIERLKAEKRDLLRVAQMALEYIEDMEPFGEGQEQFERERQLDVALRAEIAKAKREQGEGDHEIFDKTYDPVDPRRMSDVDT